MPSRDALSCPQANRLVPPAPLSRWFQASDNSSCTVQNSAVLNQALPSTLPPSAAAPNLTCRSTGSQLLPPGHNSLPSANSPFRGRAASLKRKAADNLALASAKSIRLSAASPSLVSAISSNKVLVDKITAAVSDDIFIGNNDPSLIAFLADVSSSLSSQSDILSNVVSEIECIKLTINDLQSSEPSLVSDSSNFPTLNAPYSQPPGNRAPAGISAINNRKPLKQAPLGRELGIDAPWSNVVSKKNRKARNSNVVEISEDDNDFAGSHSLPLPKVDPFVAAVKDAERSILIHNLNLGQSPTLNPSTISSKVTTAILLCIAQLEPSSQGQVTEIVRDMVDDVIGLVKGMTLFGSGTRPSRNPQNPSENCSFYTIPVKLSFANRQVCQRVTELLKGKFKMQITTPYHKTLRACFSLVQAKVRAENPDYQVRVNLDLNHRALKAYI